MTTNQPQGPNVGLNPQNVSLAYLFLRIIFGISFFNAGFTRLFDIPGFMDAMAGAMADAWMPEALVRITAVGVVFVELIVGALLILGLFTRGAAIAGFCLMAVLMYGVTIVQDWGTAGSQLIYNVIFFILLAGVTFNRYSLDAMLFGSKAEGTPGERPLENAMRFVLGKQKRDRSKYKPTHLSKNL
jgi:thiosulfate dehydrogenase [quinone] large subunit